MRDCSGGSKRPDAERKPSAPSFHFDPRDAGCNGSCDSAYPRPRSSTPPRRTPVSFSFVSSFSDFGALGRVPVSLAGHAQDPPVAVVKSPIFLPIVIRFAGDSSFPR